MLNEIDFVQDQEKDKLVSKKDSDHRDKKQK